MLTSGVFLILWTSPTDQGGIINAAIEGEDYTICCLNGTVIRPGYNAQYIMDFQTKVPTNVVSESYSLPDGKGYVTGPFLWTPPASTVSTFELRYGVFTFSFCLGTVSCSFSLGVPSNREAVNAWFSGPQGNISEYMTISKYGGLEGTSPQVLFFTAIVEIDAAGNYTLHYYNYGSTNRTGTVAIGLSSVVFSRPYLYAGAAIIVIAAAFGIVTEFVARRPKQQPQTSES